MSYDGFYRYIYDENNKYLIRKGNELFVECKTIEEALYERDRLIRCDWDWETYVELPDTPNGYIHVDLPPFEHKASYISHIKEYWTVLSRGRNPRHYGCYPSLEEAERVRKLYNGRLKHNKESWRILKKIDGKTTHFGYFKSREEAEERVKELKANGWKK